MPAAEIVVEPCPRPSVPDALGLVLRGLPTDHRQAYLTSYRSASQPGLFVARQGPELVGAVWAQLQPGNTAIFWPPQLTVSAKTDVADRLVHCGTAFLDHRRRSLAQALLDCRTDSAARLLQRHQFTYLAELIYLAADPRTVNANQSVTPALDFEPFRTSQMKRLIALIERTYVGTLDCPRLDGTRTMEEVVSGYLATGSHAPELWQFVRAGEADVGVLLLTRHPELHNWELIYMGLVPEVRGQNWGLAIVRHALQQAASADIDRLVLAVDAANRPALRIYQSCGFSPWERRHVMIRVPQAGDASKKQIVAA